MERKSMSVREKKINISPTFFSWRKKIILKKKVKGPLGLQILKRNSIFPTFFFLYIYTSFFKYVH